MSEEKDAEIQRLRDKNAALLDEKKKVQAERDELAGALEALEAERDHAQGELRRVTIEQPRRAVIDEIAHRPEVADAVQREIEHHAAIDDSGAMLNSDGEPLTDANGDPLQFGEAAIYHLATTVAPALMGMIKPANRSSGGGATGSNGRHMADIVKPKRPAEPAPRFGLK